MRKMLYGSVLTMVLATVALLTAGVVFEGGKSAFAILPADLKLVDQTVIFPTQIGAGEDEGMIIIKNFHNNGPAGPVDVDVVSTFTVPSDCTVNGVMTGAITLVVSVPQPYEEFYTINCTDAGPHQITVQNCIDAAGFNPDPEPSNNCETTVVDFAVVAPSPPVVGGEVELHAGSDSPAAASGSGSSFDYTLPVAAAVAGAMVVLAASGWYARRRWLR